MLSFTGSRLEPVDFWYGCPPFTFGLQHAPQRRQGLHADRPDVDLGLGTDFARRASWAVLGALPMVRPETPTSLPAWSRD